MAVGQLQMIDAEQPQDRGVKIVDVDRIFGDRPADFVGRAEVRPPFTPPPAIQSEKAAG